MRSIAPLLLAFSSSTYQTVSSFTSKPAFQNRNYNTQKVEFNMSSKPEIEVVSQPDESWL